MASLHVRAGIALLALGAACVWPAAGSGQVLYRSSARISRLTVSGGRMAWAEQVSRTCVRLFRRRVVGKTPVRVTRCRLPSQPVASGHTWIRLLGPHVFWDGTGRGNTEVDEWVYSTLPGGRRMPVTYTILCGGSSGAGKLLGAVSARALVYSVFTVQTDGDCGVLSGTGVVRRTVVASAGARRVLVPGAPGADMLAVSGRSLLEVPAVVSTRGIGPGSTLELRGLHSGNRRWSSAFTGTPRAIALSPSYAAMLVRTPAGAARIRDVRGGDGRARRRASGQVHDPPDARDGGPPGRVRLPAPDHGLERARAHPPRPAPAARVSRTTCSRTAPRRLEHPPRDPRRPARARGLTNRGQTPNGGRAGGVTVSFGV